MKQDAVQEIKDRPDLVDLISEHLRLQKAGRDLKGLCPFHQEKTPFLYVSPYVSPEKQLWHCYRCQKGGDHLTFIQDIGIIPTFRHRAEVPGPAADSGETAVIVPIRP